MNLLLAGALVAITVAVVVAMILVTRRGAVRAPGGHANPNDGAVRPSVEPSAGDTRR